MRKMWNTILAMVRPLLLIGVAIVLLLVLFLFKINTLTPGLSQPEIDTYNSTRTVSQIVDNGINAPYRSVVLISTKLANNTFGLRIVGAIIGILSVAIFYMLARKLFTNTVALSSTAMFATTSLLLNVSRLATANVMLLSLLAIIGIGYMIRFDKRQNIAWILASIIIGLSLYVPGMAIFVLIAAVWQFSRGHKSFESLAPMTIIICSIILSVLAAPLVINLLREPDLWKGYLGLPTNFAGITEMGTSILQAIASIFIFAPINPIYWLGRQPILDIFASALFIVGCFSLAKRLKLDRFWTLLGIFLLLLLWIGLTTNQLYLVALLPFLYIVIGFGIQELLSRWYGVFPRNPIARSVGTGLVFIALFISINFQIQRYYVAWSNNSATKEVFNQNLPN